MSDNNFEKEQNNEQQLECLLAENEVNEIKENTPIIVKSTKLFCTPERDKCFLYCSFVNISEKEVSALLLDVICYDVWGNKLATTLDVQILDLSVKKDESFENKRKIYLIDENTRAVQVDIRKVLFSDGSILFCVGEIKKVSEESMLSKNSENYITQEQEDIKIEKEITEPKPLEQEKQKKVSQQQNKEVQIQIADAMQKRMVASVSVAKKKRTIKIIVGIAVGVIIAILMINSAVKNHFNNQLRNMATETMDTAYTNVYADVVSIEPTYFIYEYKATSTGLTYGDGKFQDIVCKCKTVEGKTVWASIPYIYYPGYDMFNTEELYKTVTYTVSNPARITGSIDKAHQVTDDLDDKIGDVFVLEVHEEIKNKE